MVRSTEQLEAQLLTLPTADRARLAEILLASLDAEAETGPASAAEEAWRVEGEHRLADLRAGRVAGVPADQVFAAATRRLSA
jgi:putative addiction module component (TIGR02574 family)